MLVLKHRGGQWVELIHSSGDSIRIAVKNLEHGTCNMVFDDVRRSFNIQRSECPVVYTQQVGRGKRAEYAGPLGPIGGGGDGESGLGGGGGSSIFE